MPGQVSPGIEYDSYYFQALLHPTFMNIPRCANYVKFCPRPFPVATRRGRAYIEAYPVERTSPSYRFMGFIPMFESAGFREVGRAGMSCACR